MAYFPPTAETLGYMMANCTYSKFNNNDYKAKDFRN